MSSERALFEAWCRDPAFLKQLQNAGVHIPKLVRDIAEERVTLPDPRNKTITRAKPDPQTEALAHCIRERLPINIIVNEPVSAELRKMAKEVSSEVKTTITVRPSQRIVEDRIADKFEGM